MTPFEPHRLPADFGAYRLEVLEGRGGMAYVYRAEHRPTGRSCALKVMDPALPEPTITAQRFAREARQLLRVRHRHVVRTVEHGSVDGVPFLEMELLTGPTLEERLIRGPGCSAEESIGVLLPVLAGIQSCHDLGIVHRDLKPDNIILEPDGAGSRPVLFDFGMATGREDELGITTPNAIVGTLFYMAPEQARGRPCGPASDQYAVAAMLFEMLAGHRLRKRGPVSTLIRKAREGAIPELATELPEGLEPIVRQALAVDPGDRFSACRRFAEALLPFAAEADVARWRNLSGPSVESPFPLDDPLAPAETTMSLVARPPSKRRRVLGATALVAVGAALITAAVAAMPTSEPATPAQASFAAQAAVVGARSARSETVAFEVVVDRPNAKIYLDGSFLAQGTYQGKLNRSSRPFEVRVVCAGFVSSTQVVAPTSDIHLAIEMAPEP